MFSSKECVCDFAIKRDQTEILTDTEASVNCCNIMQVHLKDTIQASYAHDIDI